MRRLPVERKALLVAVAWGFLLGVPAAKADGPTQQVVLRFSGPSHRLELPDSPSLDLGEEFSVETWFYSEERSLLAANEEPFDALLVYRVQVNDHRWGLPLCQRS